MQFGLAKSLCRTQAIWTLAEHVHAAGIPTNKIFAGWEWAGYYHFDEYAKTAPPESTNSFADFFERRVADCRDQAAYLIVHDPMPPPGQAWEIVEKYQYFSVFSRGTESFYAVRRLAK